MKTAVIILLLVIGATVNAQYENTISLSLQPGDLGIGLRFDQAIKGGGIYGSGSIGNYRLQNGEYIKNHIRGAVGGFIYLPEKMYNYIHTKATFGVVYHYYGEKNYTEGTINESIFFPLSIELGIGTYIKRFACALRFDVIKFEGVIDFGISF